MRLLKFLLTTNHKNRRINNEKIILTFPLLTSFALAEQPSLEELTNQRVLEGQEQMLEMVTKIQDLQDQREQDKEKSQK